MTLDEAIKHCEEVAEEMFDNAVYTMDKMNSDVALRSAKRCSKCAEEHRQLAEWLKDYKRLLEQEPFMNKPCVAHKICHEDKVKVLDKIRAEIKQLPTIKCTETHKIYIIADEFKKNVLMILNKYKTESEISNETDN